MDASTENVQFRVLGTVCGTGAPEESDYAIKTSAGVVEPVDECLDRVAFEKELPGTCHSLHPKALVPALRLTAFLGDVGCGQTLSGRSLRPSTAKLT